MKRFALLMGLLAAGMIGAPRLAHPAEKEAADPLDEEAKRCLAEFVRHATAKGLPRTAVEKSTKAWTRQYHAVKKALRDYFSGSDEQRRAAMPPDVPAALRTGARFVIEDMLVDDLEEDLPEDNEQRLRILASGVWPGLRKTQTVRVVAFPLRKGEIRDIRYLSLGLLAFGGPGHSRALRSEGPYERFVVSLRLKGDKAEVVGCRKDAQFSPDDYVRQKATERVTQLLWDFWKLPRQKQERRLPPGADLPFPNKLIRMSTDPNARLRLAPGGTAPGGPWHVGLFVGEKGREGDVPMRYVALLRYDREKDAMRIVSWTRDAAFTATATEKQRVALFVKSYLEANENERQRLRAKGAPSRLSRDGVVRVFHRPTYATVASKGDGTWRVRCRIQIQGSSQFNTYRPAPYWCRVRRQPDGRLIVIGDGWGY